jgi:ABC-type nickel/cobalt efflux system permease component RcnA
VRRILQPVCPRLALRGELDFCRAGRLLPLAIGLQPGKQEGWGRDVGAVRDLVYGIFRAVGPGHGKAVIFSYLVANEETWRRGVVLSFVSAAIQSIVAIIVVAIAAVLLGATARAIGVTAHLVEITSYALVILIGLRLLYVKGRGINWRTAPEFAFAATPVAVPLSAATLRSSGQVWGQCWEPIHNPNIHNIFNDCLGLSLVPA